MLKQGSPKTNAPSSSVYLMAAPPPEPGDWSTGHSYDISTLYHVPGWNSTNITAPAPPSHHQQRIIYVFHTFLTSVYH